MSANRKFQSLWTNIPVRFFPKCSNSKGSERMKNTTRSRKQIGQPLAPRRQRGLAPFAAQRPEGCSAQTVPVPVLFRFLTEPASHIPPRCAATSRWAMAPPLAEIRSAASTPTAAPAGDCRNDRDRSSCGNRPPAAIRACRASAARDRPSVRGRLATSCADCRPTGVRFAPRPSVVADENRWIAAKAVTVHTSGSNEGAGL
jgi:hypothetical protein